MSAYYLDRPLVMGHRGAKDSAPENTIAAFEAAIQLGADAIEMDIIRCATGEIVVIHDDTVERTTDGSGRVDRLSLSELQGLDAGAWFDARFAGERIPTLDEVLDAMGSRIRLNIEIKLQRPGARPMEAELAEQLRRRGLVDDTIVSSFVPSALWRLRHAAPEIPRALLYSRDMPPRLRHGWPRFWLSPEALHPHYSIVDAEYMGHAVRAGYRVNPWTVDEEEDIQRMVDLGVDSIITDHIALTREILAGRTLG